MTIAFLFPGQSSRYPGMLDKLVELYPPNLAILDEASELLGRDLRAQFAKDNPNAFDRNVNVQVGVFLANHMMAEILAAAGVRAQLSLGLSLGEYNHLVHIGALAFRDALLLVQDRGEAYDRGPSGWMASIQPLDHDELVGAIDGLRAQGHAPLEIVNLNSPRQNVIAGSPEAIEAAITLLENDYYAQPVIIERQVPMHASVFEPVGVDFRASLGRAPFTTPKLPYIPNRLGRTLQNPTREDFIELLATHVHSPVLWRKSIDHVLQQHPDVVFVEVGVKQVLKNLLHKKWTRRPKHATDSRDGTADHLDGVLAALGSDWRLPRLAGLPGGDAPPRPTAAL